MVMSILPETFENDDLLTSSNLDIFYNFGFFIFWPTFGGPLFLVYIYIYIYLSGPATKIVAEFS